MSSLKSSLIVALITLFGTAFTECPYDCSIDPCRPDPHCIEFCNRDYQLYGDFLWWQISADDHEFARLGGVGTDATSDASEQGCIFEPKCHFEPGFRVGLLFNLCNCDWDVFGQYTYLYTNVSTQSEVGLGVIGLQPLIYTQAYGGGTDLTLARGELQTHYNVFDFGFGKTFCYDYCFDLRPHLGIKATWQELKYDVTYQESESTSVISQSVQKFTTKFDGVGLRGGFDSTWNFSHCFSIVGGVAFSAVYSEICLFREDIFTDDITEGNPNIATNVDLKKENCVVIPVLELLFGVRFNQQLCGCYDVYAFAGWENQIWFDLNRNIYIQNGTNDDNILYGPHGNIVYQGLTARLGICF